MLPKYPLIVVDTVPVAAFLMARISQSMRELGMAESVIDEFYEDVLDADDLAGFLSKVRGWVSVV